MLWILSTVKTVVVWQYRNYRPCRMLHTGHRCCWQAASQVSHTATDGAAMTSAIHCWPLLVTRWILYQIWAQCSNSQLSYCIFSIIPSYDFEPIALCTTDWETVCITELCDNVTAAMQCSMEHYDEDLYNNEFFIGFQRSSALFEHATSQRFTVCCFSCWHHNCLPILTQASLGSPVQFMSVLCCVVQIAVPRSGSVHGGSFTEVDYETHTLIPCDHKHNTLRTLNGKVIVMSFGMTW